MKFENPQSNVIEKIKSPEEISEYYKNELLPLLKIYYSEDERWEEYEDRLLEYLSSIVFRKQNIENRATESPENTFREMKEALLEKSRNIIDDYNKKTWQDRQKTNFEENELLKKAKITLIGGGDYSDWIRTHKDLPNIKNAPTDYLFNHYLNIEKNTNSRDASLHGLNSAEVNGLLMGGAEDVFKKLESSNYYKTIKETPEKLLQILIKNGDYYTIESAVQKTKISKNLSKETIEAMINSKNTRIFLENLDIFESSLDKNSLKELILSHGPNYPFKAENLVKYLEKLSWNKEDRLEIKDHILKHNFICENNLEKYLNEDEDSKYLSMHKDINDIILKNGKKYEPRKGEELSNSQLESLKKYISEGYMTFLYDNREFLKFFMETDYDWLLKVTKANDQENLLLISGFLRYEDQKEYAEKLISKGRIGILSTLIRENKITKSIVSPDSYEKLVEDGVFFPIEFIYGKLSKKTFIKITEKYDGYWDRESLFKNIDRFDLENDEKLSDYKNYQEFVEAIEGKFGLKDDEKLYKQLDLNTFGQKKDSLNKKKEEIFKKLEIVKTKLDVLYPEVINNETPIGAFNNEFGFQSLNMPDKELTSYINSISILPNALRTSNNTNLYLAAIEAAKDFNDEEKRAISDKLLSMSKIFNLESQGNFYNRYFALITNSCKNTELTKNAFDSQDIYKYCIFFKNLDEKEKEFFQELFPWSKSLDDSFIDQADIVSRGKYLIPISKNSVSQKVVDYNLEEDGKLAAEYLEKFRDNGFSKLFVLFAKIKKTAELKDMSPEVFETLKNDFNIDINQYQDINSVINKLNESFQELFSKNFNLINKEFNNPKDFSQGQAMNYLRVLALNGKFPDIDNHLVYNFFNKYTESAGKEMSIDLALYETNDKIDNAKWASNLVMYIDSAENAEALPEELKEKIDNLFSGDYRNLCFGNMNSDWRKFLKNHNDDLPIVLETIVKKITENGGAGNLKYIESLSDMISTVEKSFKNEKIAKRTKTEIKTCFNKLENRFDKENWSQDDRAEFYNLSKVIIEAAPSMFTSFSPLFEQASGRDMKYIFKNLLPLIQVELIIAQKVEGEDGQVSYSPKDLVPIRQAITNLAAYIKLYPEDKEAIFAEEKERLTDEMKNGFKERFGLIDTPTEFNKTQLKSIQNCIRYAGNISDRNEIRETLIAFYLGLELKGDWEKFREGKDIAVQDYLSKDKADLIKDVLEEKKKNSLSLEIAGIKESELDKYLQILQGEVTSTMLGNIETIDVKLGNVKRNIEDLIDSDIYENEADKKLVKILSENDRQVGTILAKIYKKEELNETETNISNRLAEALNISSWTQEDVKNAQSKIQPYSLISKMITKLREEKVDENIRELQVILEPSDKVITIFNRLNEAFKTNSGAIALSRDIEDLEELVIKNESKLSPEEKAEVKLYLDTIKEKTIKLELIFQQTKDYFNKVKNSSSAVKNNLLKNRLYEIEKIITAKDSETILKSYLTKDLNLIIENMRQCLGCLRNEGNNDTNLAFGDYNKFFLMSQESKDVGSIADQIAFFIPVKTDNGNEEMSFVLDKVYTTKKSSDILLGHVMAVYKKYESLRKEFKDANLSITVSQNALFSAGLSGDLFIHKIQEKIKDIKSIGFVEDITANVTKSALSDNYIEFGKVKGGNGGDARSSGERAFSGVVIR